MKILYVTTIGATMGFFKSFIKELLHEGHIVDIICNEYDGEVPDCYREWNCKVYHHSCSRSPFSKGNIYAIHEIKRVVSEQQYDIVHCHTPIAALCTRIACRGLRKKGLKVVYTAHGFHFYKGAPLLNWLIYYPIEKICSYFTDMLITINKEDFELAKHKMRATQVEYVPGVGIDVDKFRNAFVDKAEKRKSLGIPEDAFLIFSVGELNENKNHEAVIRTLAELNKPNHYYLVAGKGHLESYLTELTKQLNLSNKVIFLGYRQDVEELYKVADVYALPSKREGLNVSLMEAKASGLECKCYPIRGNIDIMEAESVYAFDIKRINCMMKEIYCNLLL